MPASSWPAMMQRSGNSPAVVKVNISVASPPVRVNQLIPRSLDREGVVDVLRPKLELHGLAHPECQLARPELEVQELDVHNSGTA